MKSIGIFIFLSLCLCSCRPGPGQPISLGSTLEVNLALLPLWLLIGFTIIFARKYSGEKWVQRIFAPSAIYWTLIAMVVIGFVTNFDYQYRSGCLIYEVPFLSKMKFFYSLISIGLLAIGYYVSVKWQTNSLLIFELLFWIFRGMVYSGGFDDLAISYFFLICIALRIVLIVKLYKARKKQLPT